MTLNRTPQEQILHSLFQLAGAVLAEPLPFRARISPAQTLGRSSCILSRTPSEASTGLNGCELTLTTAFPIFKEKDNVFLCPLKVPTGGEGSNRGQNCGGLRGVVSKIEIKRKNRLVSQMTIPFSYYCLDSSQEVRTCSVRCGICRFAARFALHLRCLRDVHCSSLVLASLFLCRINH
jgi:hypothetical protein